MPFWTWEFCDNSGKFYYEYEQVSIEEAKKLAVTWVRSANFELHGESSNIVTVYGRSCKTASKCDNTLWRRSLWDFSIDVEIKNP